MKNSLTYHVVNRLLHWRRLVGALLLLLFATPAGAQTVATDSIVQALDSMYRAMPETVLMELEDSLARVRGDIVEKPLEPVQPRRQRDWASWRPDPQRALWLALVIPGGGQIYNRKYWKLPLVYGGFVGCIYAMRWNNMMYKDYAQAYLDIMDNDPGTASYNKFLHLGRQITPQNEERYKSIFKKRKDRYRRYRDLSFFVMVGVYALSVIDAYVDAELSVFDLSKDLSLKVRPTVIGNGQTINPMTASALGVNCSLNF